MTNDEFGKWLNDFMGYFPGLSSYMQKLPDRKATVSGWYKTLSRYDSVMMATVTDRIVAGKFPPIEAVDYPNFATKIRPLANVVYDEHRRQEHREQYTRGQVWKAATTGNCAEMFKACCAARQLARMEELSRHEEDELTRAVAVLWSFESEDEHEYAITQLAKYDLSKEDIEQQMRSPAIASVEHLSEVPDTHVGVGEVTEG